MRLAGAALLTASGLLAGQIAAEGLRVRAERREALARMLALLAFELCRFQTPLPALFEKLAAQAEGEAAALCRRTRKGLDGLGRRSIDDIWREALGALPREERRILAPLGQVLGRYDAAEQAAAAAACREQMEQARDAARDALREKRRVYIGVSTAGAAVLAVLLL